MPLLIALLQTAVMAMPMPDRSDAAIVATINPEARVALSRGAALSLQRCDRDIDIVVAVVNQSGARSTLRLLADPPVGTFAADATPLSGAAHERRRYRLRLRRPAGALVSITGDIGPATTDIGGRNRVDLLIECGAIARSVRQPGRHGAADHHLVHRESAEDKQ